MGTERGYSSTEGRSEIRDKDKFEDGGIRRCLEGSSLVLFYGITETRGEVIY